MIRTMLTSCVVSMALLWSAARAQGRSANDEMAVQQAIIQLEHDWAQAEAKGDAATIDRIEAPDYMFAVPGGKTGNKASDISDAKSGNFRAGSVEFGDIDVHVYGDTALARGKATLRNAKWGGKDVSGEYHFLDVFVKIAGRWQAVASEATSTKPM